MDPEIAAYLARFAFGADVITYTTKAAAIKIIAQLC